MSNDIANLNFAQAMRAYHCFRIHAFIARFYFTYYIPYNSKIKWLLLLFLFLDDRRKITNLVLFTHDI